MDSPDGPMLCRFAVGLNFREKRLSRSSSKCPDRDSVRESSGESGPSVSSPLPRSVSGLWTETEVFVRASHNSTEDSAMPSVPRATNGQPIAVFLPTFLRSQRLFGSGWPKPERERETEQVGPLSVDDIAEERRTPERLLCFSVRRPKPQEAYARGAAEEGRLTRRRNR